jgi:glycosyltransferase involved in cell wall biosynthesis
MNVSIVLCTFNRARVLQRTLEGLGAMRVPPGLTWELLVVDNNSSDDTAAVVRAAAARGALPCRYLFEGRQGKSYALNTGITAAAGEIIALTDDDVMIHPDWLAATHRAFDRRDCLGIGGRVVPIWSHPKPAWYTEAGPYRLVAMVSYEHGDVERPVPEPPVGANMAFRRAAFEQHGMFDTRLGRLGAELRGGEDTELCLRLLRAGETLLYAPDAIIYHPVEPERLCRRYFEAWYYHLGRAEMYTEPPPGAAPRWLGVPRYMIRQAVEHGLLSLAVPHVQGRFYHKLNFLRHFGQISVCCEQTGPRLSVG